MSEKEEEIKEFVFSAFSNLYIFVLLQVNRSLRDSSNEEKMWSQAERLQSELLSVPIFLFLSFSCSTSIKAAVSL